MRHFVDFCQFYIIFAVAPEFSTCTILHLCHSQSKNLPLLRAHHILGTEKKDTYIRKTHTYQKDTYIRKTHTSERHIHQKDTHISERHTHIRM